MRLDAENVPDVTEQESFGSPESIITTTVDVRDFVEAKRASMRAHGSQIRPTDFFMQMPDDTFREVFGWEFFIRRGVDPTHAEDWLVDPTPHERG
jgi:LmbE family N-acetylglucosaminyl deacetylase